MKTLVYFSDLTRICNQTQPHVDFIITLTYKRYVMFPTLSEEDSGWRVVDIKKKKNILDIWFFLKDGF